MRRDRGLIVKILQETVVGYKVGYSREGTYKTRNRTERSGTEPEVIVVQYR